MKNKWTQKEKDLLLAYVFADDSDTIDQQLEFAIYKLYKSGEHEFEERSFSSVKSMFYKETKRLKNESEN